MAEQGKELKDKLMQYGIENTRDGVYLEVNGKAALLTVVFKGMGVWASPKGLMKLATMNPVTRARTFLNNHNTYDNLRKPEIEAAVISRKGNWLVVSAGRAALVSPMALACRVDLAKGVFDGGIRAVLAKYKTDKAPAPVWVYQPEPAVKDGDEPTKEVVDQTVDPLKRIDEIFKRTRPHKTAKTTK
jgi:hypothetical protein